MQGLRAVVIVLCLCGGGAAQGRAKVPSMKQPERAELPPSRLRKYYDRARDATYLNVDITLRARTADAGAGAREVKLTVQLIYKGATTADLKTAYLFVESATPQAQGERLGACKQLALKADAYEYTYARTDYQTTQIALTGAPASAPPWQKEIVAFALPLEDLPQLANAGRLELKLCTETFNANSVQLTELRNTLTSGEE